MPRASRSIAALSAVWPPRVARTASTGCPAAASLVKILSMYSAVIGSTYVLSANSGSVMIVAGLELTSVTRSPSERSTRHAWVPE